MSFLKLLRERNSALSEGLLLIFPVFENDKLSLVAVFNEVLFLANEGRVYLRQMNDDVRVSNLL